MKTKRTIRVTAMVLIITFAVSFLTFGVSAQDNANWSQKISDELLEVMSTADSKEKIPVWIWFTDIEQEEVEEQVKTETGLSEEDLDVAFKAADDAFIYELNPVSDEGQKQDLSENMDAYMDATQNERQEEKELTDKYIKARRDIARDMYVENNEENINELKLPQDEIIFQSELTSSVIINLTKSQINRVAKSKEVISIDLHIDEELVEPQMCENQTLTTRTDLAEKQFGLSGEGVNVLMIDQFCVRSDANYFSDINNPDNIKAVVNKKLYSINNTSVMPGNSTQTHPNIVAGTMQAFAPDVNIYSVGHGKYEDIEWAFLNCDIDVINVSMHFDIHIYKDNAPAKWFDSLVSTHNVTVVASSGNSIGDDGWSHTSSPGCGYNCIGAGAYKTTGNSNSDIMRNFRYNPIDPSEGRVCYKPDMVIAAGSTSEAAGSFSGVIALLLQLRPSLSINPEQIKAILMASCHRKVKPYDGTPQEYMSEGLTQRQGAGAIDTYRAISIVLKGNYGIGEISTGSTDINIVENANNSNINVSLAWLRENEYNGNSYRDNASSTLGTQQELELSVLSGSKSLGESKKTNAGKQLVYFPSETSDEYTIRVTKASENTETVEFAYAWSSEDISVKHVKLTTANSDGKITKEEVRSQLSANGIELGEDKEMFTVSFDSSVKIIGNSALSGLTNMGTVNIHDGITNISASAFKNCSELTSVTIPESVTNIGSAAFYGCIKLSSVFLQKTEAPTINDNAFVNIANDAKGYLEGYNKGYAESYGGLTIMYKSDIRTIYFANTEGWKDIKAYLWKYGTDRSNGWPGTPMEYKYRNSYGYDVYFITLDYNEYDMLIINDGSNGKQTINLDAGVDGAEYYVPFDPDSNFIFNYKRK